MTPQYSLRVRPLAQEDIADAALWYERRAAGLGARFLDEVDGILQSVVTAPELHRLVLRDVRRALVPGFPYALYYRVRDTAVEVIACMHGRRAPRRWQQRAGGP